MTLYDLAKIILLLETKPITKVRFAKTIYFVHKELINRGYATNDDITYVRMPLGPVPFGFMTLAQDHPDIRIVSLPTGLSYNSVAYFINKEQRNRFGFKRKTINPLKEKVEQILQGLRSVQTSELIEISHRDPSWISHPNGYNYKISSKDLEKPIPTQGSKNRPIDDNQLIQASLVKGMIDDIVSESTDLEYPDENTGF